MTDHTLQPAPGDEFDQSVKACAWWVPTFAEPLVGRGDKRPMLYPDAKPLYDQAALDAAVAAERERFNALLDDYRGVLETLEEMQATAAAPNFAVRAARDDAARHWASRVDGLTAQLREVDARYMALLKSVADGVALQPRTVVLQSVANPFPFPHPGEDPPASGPLDPK